MRLALALLLPVVLAGPALTGSNAVPSSVAGAGTGAVSGYTVSAISYTLEGETIDAVSFELSPPAASTVNVRLAPVEPWTPCSLDGGVAVCPVATDVAAAAALEVVAAG